MPIPIQNAVEALYQQHLTNEGLDAAHVDIANGRFDPQGHWVTEVTLDEVDYQNIVELAIYNIPNDAAILNAIANKPSYKQKLEILLGCSLVDTTYCNLDIAGHQQLEEGFNDWLADDGNQQDSIQQATQCLLKSDSRGSVIALQEEMEMHQRLISRVLESAFYDHDPEITATAWTTINKELAERVNKKVQKIYKDALVKSYQPGELQGSIDISALNKSLDKARKSISDSVHEDMLAAIIEHSGTRMSVDQFLQLWRDEVADTLCAHDFESTSATGYAYLRTDARNQTVVRIEQVDGTAHNKRPGDAMAVRRMYRNAYVVTQDDFRIEPVEGQPVEIRVPSIAVLKKENEDNIPDDEIIADVVVKLEVLHQQAFGEEDGVLKYNLLTSLPLDDGHFEKSQQIKSARYILKGAHQYNKEHRNKFVFVQNIAVNQHAANLQNEDFLTRSFQHQHSTVHEVLLMSELSLLDTLYQNRALLGVDLHAGLKTLHDNSLGHYNDFLDDPVRADGEPADDLFKSSTPGIAMRDELTEFFSNYRPRARSLRQYQRYQFDPPATTLRGLVAQALYKSFLRGEYKKGQYGMMEQAFSVFLQDKSAYGCKSANERFACVAGRVELLFSIQNRAVDFDNLDHLSDEERNLISTLRKYVSQTDVSLTRVQTALDSSFNQHNVQGSANAISNEDQGAGPKTQVAHFIGSEGVVNDIHTNHIEPSTITNLHQKNTGGLQAHKTVKDGYFSSSTNRHTKKLKDAANKMMQQRPVGSEHRDASHLWKHIQDTVGNAKHAVGNRENTFDFGKKVSDPVRERLYHLMMQQEVLYDDAKGVKSYFTTMDTGKRVYVRDARGLESAEIMDEKRAGELEKKYTKQQKNKTSRQWLVMGINYTLGLATLFETHGVTFKDGGKWLHTMAEEFVKGAYGRNSLADIDGGFQTYFLSYVRYTLAEEMGKYLPAQCQNDLGKFDLKKTLKLLDNAKDWVAMEAPSFHVATISQLTDSGSSLGEKVGDGCVVQLESPVTNMTDKQLDEFAIDQATGVSKYKSTTWYKELSSCDRALCDHYMPKILEGRVLPAQLRGRLGVGLKNAYSSKTFYSDNDSVKEIFRHGHSGGLPIILKDVVKLDEKIKEKIKELKNLPNPSDQDHDELLKLEDKKSKLEMQMLETATNNVRQQLKFAEEVTGNKDVQTLSIILNTDDIIVRLSDSIVATDYTDQLITRYSRNATKDVDRAMFARVGVALGVYELNELDPIYDINIKTNELCDTLSNLGVNKKVFQGMQQANKKLSSYLSYCSRKTKYLRRFDGINIAADVMLVIDMRNKMRRYLLDDYGSETKLHKLGKTIKEIYPFIRCASGDNRTQDGSLYAQIEAMSHASKIDVDRITALLALNGHVHIMAGSQGGSCGTVGIRKQSLDAMPLPSIGPYIRSNLGKMAKRVLAAPEADQKSVLPKDEKKPIPRLATLDTSLRAALGDIKKAGDTVELTSEPQKIKDFSQQSIPLRNKKSSSEMSRMSYLLSLFQSKKRVCVSNNSSNQIDSPRPESRLIESSSLPTNAPEVFESIQSSGWKVSAVELIEDYVDTVGNSDLVAAKLQSSNPVSNDNQRSSSKTFTYELQPPLKTTSNSDAQSLTSDSKPQDGSIIVTASQQPTTVMPSTRQHQPQPVQRIESISTKSKETKTLHMIADMVHDEMNNDKTGDYFVIEGDDFQAKLGLAIKLIENGQHDVTNATSKIRWPSLSEEFQQLDTPQQTRAVSLLAQVGKSLGHDFVQTKAYKALVHVCRGESQKVGLTRSSALGRGLFGAPGRPSRSKHIIDKTKEMPRRFGQAVASFMVDFVDFFEMLFAFL